MIYNTTELIKAIKRNASIPTSQRRFNDDDFLAFLNEELQITMTQRLLAVRQDYFVQTTDTALVASQSEYDIPTSSVGWKLEAVGYLDSSSNYHKLDIVNRANRDTYKAMSTGTYPLAYYIVNDNIHTIPDMGTSVSGSLRFDYVPIQNELVLPSSCGLITSVSDTGTDYDMTVGTIPISSGDNVDVISGTNPFNKLAANMAQTTSGSVISVTYGSSFDRAPVAGDYVCPVGKSPIPNIPEDFHPVLAQMAVIRCLISANDKKGLETASVALSNMFSVLTTRSSKRVHDSPRKVVSNNYVLNMSRGVY
jgi:hypothetical protein